MGPMALSPLPAPPPPAACEWTPAPQAVWQPLRTTLPSAAQLSGLPIPVTSCPHLPAAAHHCRSLSPDPVWGESLDY